VFIFVKFSFALFTPPLGDYQSPRGRLFIKETAFQVPIEIVGHSYPTNMIVLKGQDIDVILGMNLLVQHEVTIDMKKRTIRLNTLLGESQLPC
jgi:hypothetical protein